VYLPFFLLLLLLLLYITSRDGVATIRRLEAKQKCQK